MTIIATCQYRVKSDNKNLAVIFFDCHIFLRSANEKWYTASKETKLIALIFTQSFSVFLTEAKKMKQDCSFILFLDEALNLLTAF